MNSYGDVLEKRFGPVENWRLSIMDNGIGICRSCGEIADCVEPDAHHYLCPVCKRTAVCGIEHFILTSVA